MSSFGGLDVNVDDDDNDGIGGIIVNIRKKRRRFQDLTLPVRTCLSFQGSKDRWPFELASRWTGSLYVHL